MFQRFLHDCLIDKVVATLLQRRRIELSVERAIFLTVLHRLFAPGSDRAAEKWKDDYTIERVGGLDLHDHTSTALRGSVRRKDQKDGATPFASPTHKELVEEGLFARRRDLFSDLEVVCFDTTSIYFEGERSETIGQREPWKDHRPDLKQMVVGRRGPIVERLKSECPLGSGRFAADAIEVVQ